MATLLEACSKAGVDPATILTPTEAPVLPTRAQEITATSIPSPTQPMPTETPPGPSATPTQMPPDGKARIAFVQTSDRSGGVRKAIDLLGINPVAGKRLFLKPNFNSADPDTRLYPSRFTFRPGDGAQGDGRKRDYRR